MILEHSVSTVVPTDKSNMSSYPNILTPPSSSEDSPQPVYFVASPSSSSFQSPESYGLSQLSTFDILPQTEPVMDPNLLLGSQHGASLRFIEQPTDRFRFRYKSEMAGTHGSLTGHSSDKSRKQTYPTVELRNCTRPAIIRCSIYQLNAKEQDFMPHAHRLIMKKGKEEHDDPHDLTVGPEDGWRATFHGMGIIHTAKKNIVSELTRKKSQLKKEFIARTEGKCRELTTKEQVEIKGLAENESKSINLNIVCLRFDAFIKHNGILFPLCQPIYSHGINNLKSALTGELKIVRLDRCVSPAKGGQEIFILVERVTKKNIKIRFFETDDEDNVIWEDYGKFNDLDVHHQYAIVFKTPKYREENITKSVNVFVELLRPSDNAKSEPRDFRYIPNKVPYKPGQKRPRYDDSYSSFNSSSIGSDELPVVISNLHLQQNANMSVNNITNNSWDQPILLTSDELKTAADNIDSDEFKKIYSIFGQDFNCLDTPIAQNEMIKQYCPKPSSKQNEKLAILQKPSRIAIKYEVTEEDKHMAARTIEELRSFVKTNHNPFMANKMLSHYFDEDCKTNALHVAICQNNTEDAVFILKLIALFKYFDVVNKRNSDSKTPLHLAVLCHNELLVKYLLMCKAKCSETDDELNTALHVAVAGNVSTEILELLLSSRQHESVDDYINTANADGESALIIAVNKKNKSALKLLHSRGANINQQHHKNGFTPLRFAIEGQYVDIIKYLLTLPDLIPTIKDFKSVSPLAVANLRESSKEIMEVLNKYMEDNNLEVEIKEELEDDSDEDMDEESDVKPEILSPEELENLYKNATFTPQCLSEVCALLDESGKWEDLAVLLDVSHMIRSGIINSDQSISKSLLTYAIEVNNDSLWMIRNFLENLDELRAVEIMDKMVQEN